MVSLGPAARGGGDAAEGDNVTCLLATGRLAGGSFGMRRDGAAALALVDQPVAPSRGSQVSRPVVIDFLIEASKERMSMGCGSVVYEVAVCIFRSNDGNDRTKSRSLWRWGWGEELSPRRGDLANRRLISIKRYGNRYLLSYKRGGTR